MVILDFNSDRNILVDDAIRKKAEIIVFLLNSVDGILGKVFDD
jgi:hypothetical protein